MHDSSNPLLLPNGAYKVNLLSDEHQSLCSDQPQGAIFYNGQREDSVVPPGVIIVKDFLSTDYCNQLTRLAEKRKGKRMCVMFRDPHTGQAVSRPDKNRITEYVDLRDIQEKLSDVVDNACRNVLIPHYKADIEWYERPAMLRYGIGGKYEHHSDSENWNANTRSWQRFCDRAYSLLIYLNDDFTGGSLYFPNFDFRFRPSSGALVAFPSDHRYVHRAEPVQEGTRYAVVSWVVEKGRRHFTRGKPIPPHAVPLR